jgi:hypothetical protein
VPVLVVIATAIFTLLLGMAVDVDREMQRSLLRLLRRDRAAGG